MRRIGGSFRAPDGGRDGTGKQFGGRQRRMAELNKGMRPGIGTDGKATDRAAGLPVRMRHKGRDRLIRLPSS